ncbi:hypothetical protein HDU87_000054 [Geranomyces variabilis]|uniref:MOSC domain-containing protein n=1 Tax=Geranomyces variabilis TaxID=109894 RepID=A0AAD5TWK0_9FUNG|nr:hypothetical protein HDU87_000054 [Geranomyces variabilis]
MVTQRTHPKLALISTALFLTDAAADHHQPATAIPPAALAAGGSLVLSAPGMSADLQIPFIPSAASSLPLVTAELHHGETTHCRDEGTHAAEWLETFLGLPVRLLRKDTETVRELDPLHTPARELFVSEPQTALADGYPFLILSDASVADLNVRLAARNAPAVTLHNFRPNIFISSPSPYFEETFFAIAISQHELYINSRCVRCVLPNNDPQTGLPHKKEPLATLMSYRRVDPGAKWTPCLGVNATHRDAGWSVRVGDVVSVTRSGDFHHRDGVWRGGREPVPVGGGGGGDKEDADGGDDQKRLAAAHVTPPAVSAFVRVSPIVYPVVALAVVVAARFLMAS